MDLAPEKLTEAASGQHHLLPPEKPLYTIAETAEALRSNRTTVYRLHNAGRLRLVKIGRRTFARRDDLEALIDGLGDKP
jgi:excisionase family DNA binding protein